MASIAFPDAILPSALTPSHFPLYLLEPSVFSSSSPLSSVAQILPMSPSSDKVLRSRRVSMESAICQYYLGTMRNIFLMSRTSSIFLPSAWSSDTNEFQRMANSLINSPLWNFTFSNALRSFYEFPTRMHLSPNLMVFTTVHTSVALFLSVMLDFISAGTA
jgi:hypothetical protein